MTPFLFAAQSLLHEGQRRLTTERVVNLYAEPLAARQPLTLRSTPGLVDVTQLEDGRVEAMHSDGTTLHAAVNGRLVTWNGTTATDRGALATGRATMANRGTAELAIVAGGRYFVFDGTTLTEVAGTAFTSIGSVDFIDGFMVLTEAGGQRHAVSDLNDALTLPAADFASAEHRGDNLVRVLSNGGLLWLFGVQTTEIWENVGNATGSPFSPLQSTIVEKGLRSVAEAARMDNSVFWIGSDHRAYRAGDFTPQKVSPGPVDAAIQAHTGAVCFTYAHQGHDFFVIRFSDRPAWVFDAATQMWHERATGADFDAWEVTATVEHRGVWYAGTETGHLCTFGGYQDRGAVLRREATGRNISQGGDRFRVAKLDLRCEAGTGGTVMLSLSKDGGATFSRERLRSVGGVGDYRRRVQWNGLGQMRECAVRVACTDNVDFAIYDAGVSLG